MAKEGQYDEQPPAEIPASSVDAIAGPQPHRCNDRVEDVIQALFTLEFGSKIRPAWSNMWACFRSEKGQEPRMPYLVIKDGQQFLVRQERKDPPANFAKRPPPT